MNKCSIYRTYIDKMCDITLKKLWSESKKNEAIHVQGFERMAKDRILVELEILGSKIMKEIVLKNEAKAKSY